MDKYKAFYKFVADKLNDTMIKSADETITEVKALVQFIETLGDEEKE